MRLRSIHSLGLEVLEDYGKKASRRAFFFRTKACLEALYGEGTPIVQQYTDGTKTFLTIEQPAFVALLLQLEQILSYLERVSGAATPNAESVPSPVPAGKNVFIIHGHDELNTHRLKELLQDHFGLSTVLMKSNPGMSRPLLDKFEHCASTCAFAFALMTPDDQVVNQSHAPYYQARPNVFFEAGWFAGRLGISRVCLLLKPSTIVQSDLEGISRIHFDENVQDKLLDIERELRAVGILQKAELPNQPR